MITNSRVEHFILKQLFILKQILITAGQVKGQSPLLAPWEQGLFSHSFLSHAAPCDVWDIEQTLNKCLWREWIVINVWMKLYITNLVLIFPFLRPLLKLANIKIAQQCWLVSTLAIMITYWEVSHYLHIIDLTYLRSICVKYLGYF